MIINRLQTRLSPVYGRELLEMAIREGQVLKVVEGRRTLLAMLGIVRGSPKKKAFDFNIVEDDGLRSSMFEPKGEPIETTDVVVVLGNEYGSEIPAKLVVYKNDQLDAEIGSLVFT